MNPDIWATWIGKQIAKAQGGKFKSDERVAIPQSIVPHPQHPRAIPAFVLEDGSVISCASCILCGTKPEWKDAPADAVALFLNEAGEWEWSAKSDRTRKFNSVRPKAAMADMDPVARAEVELVAEQRARSLAVQQRANALYSQLNAFRQTLDKKLGPLPPGSFGIKEKRDEKSRTMRRNRLRGYVRLADTMLKQGISKENVLTRFLLVYEKLSDAEFQDTLDDFYGDEA